MAHSGSRDSISLVPGLGHEARTVVYMCTQQCTGTLCTCTIDPLA